MESIQIAQYLSKTCSSTPPAHVAFFLGYLRNWRYQMNLVRKIKFNFQIFQMICHLLFSVSNVNSYEVATLSCQTKIASSCCCCCCQVHCLLLLRHHCCCCCCLALWPSLLLLLLSPWWSWSQLRGEHNDHEQSDRFNTVDVDHVHELDHDISHQEGDGEEGEETGVAGLAPHDHLGKWRITHLSQ